MSDAVVPDFVIGGAPKCGTTSLYMWLSKSPDVVSSYDKETNFLIDRRSWLYTDRCYDSTGIQGYRNLFPKKGAGQKLMEGCAMYLYSETARNFFSDKDTKMVFIIRNPVDRLVSNYKYFFKVNRGGDVDFSSYVDALMTEGYGSSNEQISEALAHGEYHEYLRKWFSDVGEERVYVVFLEELNKNPKIVMQKLCAWLDIDSSFLSELSFDPDNASYVAKSKFLHFAARILSRFLPSGDFRNMIKNFYIRVNGNKKGAEYDVGAIKEYYEKPNQELEHLIGKPVKDWS